MSQSIFGFLRHLSKHTHTHTRENNYIFNCLLFFLLSALSTILLLGHNSSDYAYKVHRNISNENPDQFQMSLLLSSRFVWEYLCYVCSCNILDFNRYVWMCLNMLPIPDCFSLLCVCNVHKWHIFVMCYDFLGCFR